MMLGASCAAFIVPACTLVVCVYELSFAACQVEADRSRVKGGVILKRSVKCPIEYAPDRPVYSVRTDRSNQLRHNAGGNFR